MGNWKTSRLSPVFNVSPVFNDNGNVQGITNNKNTARNQSFLYDGLNRLTQAVSGTSWGNTYTYDPWGNLYQTGSVSGTTWNAMTVSQQITGTNRFQLSGYVYDAAGNVLADGINSGCGSYAYSWNAEEQMSCAAGSTYTYDGEGARVEKNGGNSTPTLYWGGLVESNLSGTVTSEYIFVGGRRVGRRDVSTGSVYYYFEDMLGSSSVVATSTGAVENESDFYPFGGESVITQNLSNQKFKFTGKERDTESGLDYFGARYYGSSMGRFMSPDWSAKIEPVPYSRLGDPQSLNLYAYVGNNPLSRIDPDGHELVKLGQHTDDEINARTKAINGQLKDKSLSADARSALKAEKTTLGLEKQGNAVIGGLLSKLDQTGQRNGLQLSNFTLSTDTKNDFAGVATSGAMAKLVNDQAFVIQGTSKYSGTIYVRTEPESGFYQMSQRSSDFGYFGASAISHEQVHLNGGGEYPAYQRQLGVFEGFHNYFQNQQLYQGLDDFIRGGINANQPH